MIFENKKKKEVLDLVDQHCDLVRETVDRYQQLVQDYLAADKAFKEDSRQIDELESAADMIRFKVERLMYRGAFLPAHRGDYIDLLERLDRVANAAEESGDHLTLVRPAIPEIIHDDLRKMAELTVQAFAPLPAMIRGVLRNDFEQQQHVERIGELESEIDRLQFKATRTLYRDTQLEKIDKLLGKLTIDHIGKVSDRIENVGDRISLIAIKRKLA
jgi:hypothetical protein